MDESRLEEVTALRVSLEGLATELGVARISDSAIDEVSRIQDEIEARGEERDFSWRPGRQRSPAAVIAQFGLDSPAPLPALAGGALSRRGGHQDAAA